MTFTVGICKDEDFEEMMPMMFGTMGGYSQFINALWPHNLTKEGQEKHRQGFLNSKAIDTSQRWLKATDKESGKIVGIAEWLVYDGPKPAEVGLDHPAGYWDTPDEEEWAQALFKSFMEDRRRVLREASGAVMCLSILVVDPSYQYRGIGTALTKWGVDLADEMDAECTVESSTAGRWLYEQQGFILQRHFALDFPEKFADRKKERLFYMYRPKKSTLQDGTLQKSPI